MSNGFIFKTAILCQGWQKLAEMLSLKLFTVSCLQETKALNNTVLEQDGRISENWYNHCFI